MKKGIIFLTLAFLFAICSMAGFAFCAGTLCGIYILCCGAVSALLLYFGLSNILRCLSQQKKDYQSFILHQNEQLLNALSAQQTVAKDNTEALHNMCKSTHEELLSVLDDLTEKLRNFSQAQHKQLQAFMNQQHHTTKQQTDTITDLLIKSIEQLNSIHNTLDAVTNILCRSDDSIDSQNIPTVCDMLQALHTDNLTLFAEQQKNFNQDLFLKEEFFKGSSAFLVAIRELLRNISTIIYQSDSNNTNPEQITSLHSLLTNIQKSIPESTGQLKKLISDNGFQLDEITTALDDSSDSLNAYLSDLKTYLAKYSDLSQQDAALLKNLLEEPYD